MNACIFNLASFALTCMWFGTIGNGRDRGNGLVSVIVAWVLRVGQRSGLIISVVVRFFLVVLSVLGVLDRLGRFVL